MKNYIQPGNQITVAAPELIASGDGVLIGALFGVANGDAPSGQPLVLSTVGVFTLPKKTTDAIAVGAALYWDADESEVTVTATDNTRIGHAVTAAGNPSARVAVRLSI